MAVSRKYSEAYSIYEPLTSSDVKAFRAGMGLTQEELAWACDLSIHAINKWERFGAIIPGHWRLHFAALEAELKPWRSRWTTSVEVQLNRALRHMNVFGDGSDFSVRLSTDDWEHFERALKRDRDLTWVGGKSDEPAPYVSGPHKFRGIDVTHGPDEPSVIIRSDGKQAKLESFTDP